MPSTPDDNVEIVRRAIESEPDAVAENIMWHFQSPIPEQVSHFQGREAVLRSRRACVITSPDRTGRARRDPSRTAAQEQPINDVLVCNRIPYRLARPAVIWTAIEVPFLAHRSVAPRCPTARVRKRSGWRHRARPRKCRTPRVGRPQRYVRIRASANARLDGP